MKSARISYHGEVVAKAEPLELDRILASLPPEGFGGAVSILDVCEGEVRELLMDPERSLLPDSELPKVFPRPKVQVAPGEWEKIAGALRAWHCRPHWVRHQCGGGWCYKRVVWWWEGWEGSPWWEDSTASHHGPERFKCNPENNAGWCSDFEWCLCFHHGGVGGKSGHHHSWGTTWSLPFIYLLAPLHDLLSPSDLAGAGNQQGRKYLAGSFSAADGL